VRLHSFILLCPIPPSQGQCQALTLYYRTRVFQLVKASFRIYAEVMVSRFRPRLLDVTFYYKRSTKRNSPPGTQVWDTEFLLTEGVLHGNTLNPMTLIHSQARQCWGSITQRRPVAIYSERRLRRLPVMKSQSSYNSSHLIGHNRQSNFA